MNVSRGNHRTFRRHDRKSSGEHSDKQEFSIIKKGEIMIEYFSRREFIGKSALMTGGALGIYEKYFFC